MVQTGMQLPQDTKWPIGKRELLNSELRFCNILRMGMQFQVHPMPGHDQEAALLRVTAGLAWRCLTAQPCHGCPASGCLKPALHCKAHADGLGGV